VRRWTATTFVAAAMCTTVIITSSCTSGGSDNVVEESSVSSGRIAEMNKRLQGLTRLDEVALEFEMFSWRIAAAVDGVVPGLVWEEGQRVGKLACPGELVDSDGFVISTTMLVSSTPIPPEKWMPALAAVQSVAAEMGLTELTVRQDQPSSHDVMLNGSDGASLTFGSRKAVLISMTTPCRLEDRRDS
jgi:hypothetical protein